MISGECPYDDCDEGFLLVVPEDVDLPAWYRHTCDTCGRAFWERYSRWDPYAMTEEDFLKVYTVNEETRELVRNG